MTLLILYFALAVGVSFLCSLCEAALLSISVSEVELLARSGRRAGVRLRDMKRNIDKPLAAILSLNTISHTIGAAGVGAQSIVVFGEVWIGLTSAVLTVLILVISEIIPKTIGATHARLLALPTTMVIQVMIWITMPIVICLNAIVALIKGKHESNAPTREQIEVAAELARMGGTLRSSESKLVSNLLRLQQLQVERVMTPRTVVFTLDADDTPAGVLGEHPRLRHSRIPVRSSDDPDTILGVALKHEIHEAVIGAKGDRTLGSMLRSIHFVPEKAPLLVVLDEFGRLGHHLFGVADEHGSFVGIVTLEDIVESILGREIIDETDLVADMRHLAEG